MRKFNNGLVVGKFCPLHKGHQLLLDVATLNCNHLMIISYTSEDLGYSAAVRRKWLKELYPTAQVIVRENHIPKDDDSAYIHREFCATICEAEAFNPDAVFSSEEYGDGFAEHLSSVFHHFVEHVIVDQQRETVQISGTRLRTGVADWDHFVHPIVARDRAPGRRILLIGGESSGKTTLAKLLSELTDFPWVHEYGRELFEEQNGWLADADYLRIAQTQIAREDEAAAKAAVVFCDTSPLVTLFYAQAWAQSVDPRLIELAKRKYSKIYMCKRDFEFVNDGTRINDAFSRGQEAYYIDQLRKLDMDYELLRGSISDRAVQVLRTYRNVD